MCSLLENDSCLTSTGPPLSCRHALWLFLDYQDTDNLVIDHQHFASVPGQPVDHTLVVATDIINASVIVGPVEMQVCQSGV